jgi:hypothetical protein
VESVAAFAWNQWQLSCGTGGSFRVESVAGLAWNTQLLIPFTGVPAYVLPVYASPGTLPYTTQDSVPDCWRGFVRAAISGGWTVCACKAQPPQNRAHPSPSTRLKQSTYPKRRTAAVNLAMAGVMHEPQMRESICAPAVLGDHMVDVESLTILQVLMTDGTETLRSLDEVPATKCRPLRLRPSLSPVVL